MKRVLYSSIHSPQHTTFLRSRSFFGYIMKIEEEEEVVEQNTYATKTVDAYICYELVTSQEILLAILH